MGISRPAQWPYVILMLAIVSLSAASPPQRAAALPGRDSAGSTATQVDEAEAQEIVRRFKEKDPGLVTVFEESAGYVVFPTVAKGGLGIGGARGKGYVYAGGQLVGRSTLTQVTIGLQAGGQAYSEVVFLKDRAALENLKRGRLKLDAQTSAIALTERVSVDLAYRNGVAIVTMAQGGLMYEASVGGQKLSFHSLRKTS